MPLAESTLRDAAVLVSCLDEADAQGLLAVLGPAPAGRIRGAISTLGAVSRTEREAVMRAFLESPIPGTPRTRSNLNAQATYRGVEMDEGLARRIAQARAEVDSPASNDLHELGHAPFAFLLETEAEVVAPFLARESPQTVAVVLSFLRRTQAAQLLRRLEPSFQSQVLSRLAHLDEIDAASIDVVADELKTWIERQHAARSPRPRSDRLLRDVLSSEQIKDREELLNELRRTEAPSEPVPAPVHPRVDTRPNPPRQALTFNDLVRAADDVLIRMVQTVPRETLILALVGADGGLTARICQCISRREAKQLKRSLRLEGPTRLGDIEEAQRRVAEIATEILGQEGR